MNMVLNHKGHDGQDTERKQILCLSVLMKDSTFTNAHEVDDEDDGASIEGICYECNIRYVELLHVTSSIDIQVTHSVRHLKLILVATSILAIVEVDLEKNVEANYKRGHIDINQCVDERLDWLLAREAIVKVEVKDADGEYHGTEDEPQNGVHKPLAEWTSVPEEQTA